MSHQFKPGDLAVIVRVSRSALSENLGRVVQVIHVDPEDERLDVHFVAEGLLCQNGEVPGVFRHSDAWCHHSWLMPLRGDFQPERQRSREVRA